MGQVIQVAGALAVLLAFALAQLGRWQPSSLRYLAVNLAGASVLAAEAWLEAQWGFLVLEAAWAAVSAAGLLGALRD